MGSDASVPVYSGVAENSVRVTERLHITQDRKDTASFSAETQWESDQVEKHNL